MFSNLARRQSLLFYADDLHWADRGTLWLLGHLLRQLRDERVLIVGAYRETELDRAHPLAKSLVDWNRERLVTRIVLRRFNTDETSDQLSALLGENVSGEFAVAVHRETEGNPFFVEEVLKALVEQGSVRREGGRWTRCKMDELLIPQSVKEAIGNRLDRVSQECNEVLRLGAILGKVFTFNELSAAAEQSEDALLDALDEATNAQLIAPISDDSFSFTHDKIREVLYEELNPIRRRRLHRHVAEGLARIRGKSCCGAEKLAHHYIQAGDLERGLHYAKQAAAEAQRVFAFDEAIAAYGRACDCAEALGLVNEQLEQQEAMGEVYMLHGETILAGEHFERALALATDQETRVRLQCQAASSLVTTGDVRGIDYINEALRVLDPVANPVETANALATEARFHHLAGRHKKAIEILLRAAELVEPAANRESVCTFTAPIIAQVYAYLAGAHQHYGLYSEADRWAWRAVKFGTTHNVLFAEATGYEFLGENSIHKGEFEAGLEYADREIEIAKRLQSRQRLAWAQLIKAQCRSFLGQNGLAEQEFDEGIRLAEAIGESRASMLLRTNLAVVQASLGRHDEALRNAKENLRRSSSSLLYMHFEGLRCMAKVHLRRNELDEAEDFCRQADELIASTESRISRLWLGPLYIDILVAKGKRDEALQKLSVYQGLVDDCESPRFTAEAGRLKMLLVA